MSERVFGDAPGWLRGLIVIQVGLILAAATVVALRSPLLDGPDERANVSYVQIVADHGRLPIQDRDCISADLHELALRLPWAPCARARGTSYEAFQPPLYYAAAAPIWLVVPGVAAKVRALRMLDVLLLAAAIGTLWWLCREALGRRRAYGWTLALCGLAIPAVVVEQVFVGNDALEMALVPAVLAACLRAARRPYRHGELAIAAVLLGATLLTKLTSVYLVVPVGAAVLVRLWARRSAPGLPRAALAEVALVALIPLVLLAPWLIDNERHYHALTADHLAHVWQEPVLNPGHVRYTWAQMPAYDRTIVSNYLPKVCGVPQGGAAQEPLQAPVSYLALAVILVGSLVLLRRGRGMAALCTLLPVGVATLAFDAVHVLAQQYIDLARFLHPTVGPFGSGVALLADPRGAWARRAITGAAALATAAAAAYWLKVGPSANVLCP